MKPRREPADQGNRRPQGRHHGAAGLSAIQKESRAAQAQANSKQGLPSAKELVRHAQLQGYKQLDTGLALLKAALPDLKNSWAALRWT